ncbi:MAG: hypothetical protein ABF646_10300 [Acetobacter papayae]
MSMENRLLLGRSCHFLCVCDHESGLRALREVVPAGTVLDTDRPAPVLLSPEGAGVYMGVVWWHALMSGLAAALTGAEKSLFSADASGAGGLPFTHVLDCGGSAVHAVMALRSGQRAVVLNAQDGQAMAARRLYQQAGGVVLACRPAIISPN